MVLASTALYLASLDAGDSLTFVLVSTSIHAASITMTGIILPLTLILVPRGIPAPALAMPLTSLPFPHILASVSQPALPYEETCELYTILLCTADP